MHTPSLPLDLPQAQCIMPAGMFEVPRADDTGELVSEADAEYVQAMHDDHAAFAAGSGGTAAVAHSSGAAAAAERGQAAASIPGEGRRLGGSSHLSAPAERPGPTDDLRATARRRAHGGGSAVRACRDEAGGVPALQDQSQAVNVDSDAQQPVSDSGSDSLAVPTRLVRQTSFTGS